MHRSLGLALSVAVLAALSASSCDDETQSGASGEPVGSGAAAQTNGSGVTTSSGAQGGSAATGGATGGGALSYSTTFPVDENPISENGAWSAIASPWLRIRSVGGIAKADAYVTGYNDNYAILSGFGPDVEITATVYISGGAPFGEILLLARMAHTATTLRGYEFLYDGDGSVQLMRWNGPSGDFSPMGGEGSSPGPLEDNDQLRMRVVGDTITAFHRRPPADWVQIGQTVDATFADGQPGLGFFVRDEGQTIDAIGLHDYSATEIR
jgi:hypothetical protein